MINNPTMQVSRRFVKKTFCQDRLRRFVRTALRVVAGGYELLWGSIIGWLRVVTSGYEWLWLHISGKQVVTGS